MDPDSTMKIAGGELSTYLVQEVFDMIRHEHVEMVLRNLSRITGDIYTKKSYIRTALYNAVFESQIQADRAEVDI